MHESQGCMLCAGSGSISTLVAAGSSGSWPALHQTCCAMQQGLEDIADPAGLATCSKRKPGAASSPVLAQAPVDAAHNEAEDDGEEHAHAVVFGQAPVGDVVLPQQPAELLEPGARVGRVEVQRLAALLGLLQLHHHVLHLPARQPDELPSSAYALPDGQWDELGLNCEPESSLITIC